VGTRGPESLQAYFSAPPVSRAIAKKYVVGYGVAKVSGCIHSVRLEIMIAPSCSIVEYSETSFIPFVESTSEPFHSSSLLD
jgi:hypothetical protein